jgi:tetracycline 7-halogenase / FADH2 O2-dependent halogenase
MATPSYAALLIGLLAIFLYVWIPTDPLIVVHERSKHWRSCHSDEIYDVAILGGGFAGTSLASMLRKGNKTVLLIDSNTHPRFALGESIIPPSSKWLDLIGHHWDLPVLRGLFTPTINRNMLSKSSGIKNNFGYVYHRPGEEQPSPKYAFTYNLQYEEAHMYRADADAFLASYAMDLGVCASFGTKVQELKVETEENVQIVLQNGQKYQARFLVDAAGFGSPLAKTIPNMRIPNAGDMKTTSRTLFTHLHGVIPYDLVLNSLNSSSYPIKRSYRFHEGTLHHVFDGGWMWVIPFDNGGGSQRAVSVGVNFDTSRWPDTPENQSPQEEWDAFLAQFPAVQAQFKHAQPLMPWIRTKRLQWTTYPEKLHGKQYALSMHAAMGIDALYSRGLYNALAINHMLALSLTAPSAERDKLLDLTGEHILQLGELNDKIIYISYLSYRDPEMWLLAIKCWRSLSFVHAVPLVWLQQQDAEGKDMVFSRRYLDILAEGGSIKTEVDEIIALMERSDASYDMVYDRMKNSTVLCPHIVTNDLPGLTAHAIKTCIGWMRLEAHPELRSIANDINLFGTVMDALKVAWKSFNFSYFLARHTQSI